MGALQITLGTLCALVTVVAVVMVTRTTVQMVRTLRVGQPTTGRSAPVGARLGTMLKESLAHTRMNKWSHVGIFHWMVMVGFLGLILPLLEAFVEVFDPSFKLPLLGTWTPWNIWVELLGTLTMVGIIPLAIYRQARNPKRLGRASRFYGSNMGRAYFVEAVVFIEGAGIIGVRAAKIADGALDVPTWAAPVSTAIGSLLPADPNLVSIFATVKIFSAMVWLIVIAAQPTMGVAWHRFTAFPNIYFKRNDDGSKALGPVKPMTSNGKVLDLEEADPETDVFGAGRVEDFTWKGLLDFTTCTECGRCQSQCPAWNTGKPLSPKLLITALRDHSYAKAPYMLAGGSTDMTGEEVGITGDDAESRLAAIPQAARDEAARPLIGEGDVLGVIDPEILWSCTSCGACVEQCPVDIEHVDHIIDMRRHQVMIESAFPTELGTLFKNLENKGNPWGQNNSTRADWAADLPFDVPVYDGELAEDTEYLFWIGCAGSFDDNAKKTVRAVAELLHIAGVNYTTLGKEESCTGDPARRSGNEFLFQMMAQQTAETLNAVFEGREPGTRKIVTTCPHCMNSLGREYPQFDGEYEVVHHTQLLNQLVRDKKLVPVAPSEPAPALAGASNGSAPLGGGAAKTVTYHDPCYLGRHNEVYSPPRELVGAAGATLKEMPRHADRAMCCGAGGARMWMEEKIGKRINLERIDEAISTETETVATGCPFCRVMLTDGLTSRQAEDQGVGMEVMDVSQMLLEAVKRTPSAPGDPAPEHEVDHAGDSDPDTTATSANVEPSSKNVPSAHSNGTGSDTGSSDSAATDGGASTGAGADGAASTGTSSTGASSTGASSTGASSTGASSTGASSTGAASTGSGSNGAGSGSNGSHGADPSHVPADGTTTGPASDEAAAGGDGVSHDPSDIGGEVGGTAGADEDAQPRGGGTASK